MNPLDFVLDLYRLAQEVPASEFQDLALEMLKAQVPFHSASWSDAEISRSRIVIRSAHLHNDPREMRLQFSSVNRQHTRRLEPAVRNPGQAHVINDSIAFYNRREEAPMRAYLKRYSHERNLLITDREQWVSLYRPFADRTFTARDVAIVNTLMPHLVEAIRINRAIALGESISGGVSGCAGARALVDRNGVFLHCRNDFLDLLRLQWRDWAESSIPPALLNELRRRHSTRIAGGAVEVLAKSCGEALLLLARRVSRLASLSPRELEVARHFGYGKSYKAIAMETQLAPATVRNVLQKAYRKLQVDNKAALARLVQSQYG